MLEQIFTKEFLTKARKNLVIALSLIKYACFAVGLPGAILCGSGVDAPEPYGSNTFKACIFCVSLMAASMIIEMLTVRFLVKDNEHIQCIFDFNWYGLKSYDNWKKYKKYLKKVEAEERARDIKFKKMMAIANSFSENTESTANVIQFPNTQTVRYKNLEVRRM